MPASVGGPMPEGVQLCPKAHFGYMVSGQMKVMMPDTKEEKVISAGDVSVRVSVACAIIETAVCACIAHLMFVIVCYM